MEVRDIFAMRKEGRYEEAYQAISHIYAFHQGPHTNLCMFWCTNDILKLRLKERKAEQSKKLLYQLIRLYPQTDDRLSQGNRAIVNAALALDRLEDNFNFIYFMPYFNRLTDADWQPYMVNGHQVPSLGQQVVNHLLKDLPSRSADYINQVADIFHTAFQKSPYYKENLRHLAQMHTLLGHTDKASAIYKKVLQRHHDSYLYAELAKLIDNKKTKTALYCMAVAHQRREEFRAKYHFELALLMQAHSPRCAAYELGQYISIRQRHRQPLPSYALRLQKQLKSVNPISTEEEQQLYERAKGIVEELLTTRS